MNQFKKDFDTNAFVLALNTLVVSMQETFGKLILRQSEDIYVSVNGLLEAWLEFTRHVMINPDKLATAQFSYWQDYLLLCKDLHQRLSDNSAHRHLHDVSDSIIIGFLEKFHFLVTQHTHSVIKKVFSHEEEKHIGFFQRRFIEDFSLANFLSPQIDFMEVVKPKTPRAQA